MVDVIGCHSEPKRMPFAPLKVKNLVAHRQELFFIGKRDSSSLRFMKRLRSIKRLRSSE